MAPAFPLAQSRLVLGQTPATLEALLKALPDNLLDVNEGAGTWSPRQVLCHLAWAEVDDWMPRVRRVLKGEAFTPFDRDVGFARYSDWPVDRLLDEFHRLRKGSLTELDALHIGPDQLRLEGRHPEFGRVTLEQLLATWVVHDFAHLSQITRVLTRHHGQWVGPWQKYFSLLRRPGL